MAKANWAAYCAKFNFQNIFGKQSYLGSYAEWKLVADNYTKVRDALLNAGGFDLDDQKYGSFYHTSCESRYADRSLQMYISFKDGQTIKSMSSKEGADSDSYVVPFYQIQRPFLAIT